MFVIGVTGNIGSGKSTVCGILARLGAVVIDADKLAHEAYKPHSQTWQEIVTAFGEGIVKSDYEIDREKLGRIVFSNPDALARLNQIVHPEAYRLAQDNVSTGPAADYNLISYSSVQGVTRSWQRSWVPQIVFFDTGCVTVYISFRWSVS